MNSAGSIKITSGYVDLYFDILFTKKKKKRLALRLFTVIISLAFEDGNYHSVYQFQTIAGLALGFNLHLLCKERLLRDDM